MEPTVEAGHPDTREAPPGPAVAADPALRSARALVAAGSVREALAALGSLHRHPSRLVPLDRALLLATLVDWRLARGDLTEATALGAELDALLSAGGTAAAVAHHAKGELASALHDPELALAHFLTVGRLVPDIDADVAPWRAGAALAAMRTGDQRQAAVLARRFVEEAAIDDRPRVRALALRTLAAVDGGSARLTHLRTARALIADGSADRLAAQIETDLAGLLLISPHVGDHVAALGLLRTAEDLAGRQELWPLQGRIRRHLERLGETPRRVELEAASLLTPAERRVTRLAITGLTNRQIAETLAVSVKAVEWHLSHVYRKLGITVRGQLAGVLGSDFDTPTPGRRAGDRRR